MSNVNQNDNPTDESGLRFYGIGIVAENKPRNGDFIMVSPVEKVTSSKGRLAETEHVYEVESLDVNGIVSKEKVTGQSIIKAKWMPLSEGNRQTAPDVREGESVRLWKYGNASEYYWQTMYREPGIRRLETVLYCYGNLPSGNTPWDKDSSYWHEVSTHDQHLWWKTTQSNGEAYSYDIKLDTRNSNYTVHDNVGNIFLLDSQNTLIRMINADGSFVELDKQRYHGQAKEHMTHESDDIHMKTPLFIVAAGDEGGHHSGAFIKVDSGGNTAQIGSGNDAYTHMTDGNMETKTKESITEETKSKTVKNQSSSIESETLTERYGNVTRETGNLTETTGTYTRTGGGVSETLSTLDRDIGTSTEKYGSQDKTADKVTEKVAEQKSEVDKLEQTSKEQTIKSDTMTEEYAKQAVKVGDKTEEATTITSTVSSKEEKTVGDYLLTSGKVVDIRSNEGIKLTDTTASNLDVPGKIKLGDKDLGATLQSMSEKDGSLGSDIETLADRTTKLETSLGQTIDKAKEAEEQTIALKDKLSQTDQQLTDSNGRVSANEDEITKLKTKVIKLEEQMVEVLERLTRHDRQLEVIESQVVEIKDRLSNVEALATAAMEKANQAMEAAAAAAVAAAAAGEAAAAAGGGTPV